MPEGHTLHRLAGALGVAFAGTVPAVSSPQGRFSAGAALLDGRRVEAATAWGKHLFVEFEGDAVLHVHLGLYGRFDVTAYDEPAGLEPPVGQVRLRLAGAAVVADLRGPTACEVITLRQMDDIVGRLGPDPLRPESDPHRAWVRLHASRRTVAELLLDQAVVAGVGNVYRSEVLYRNRVAPLRPGHQLRRSTWEALWDDLVVLMALGVRLAQIVTMDDQVEQASEMAVDSAAVPALGGVVSPWRPTSTGPLERRHYVYRRADLPCVVCGSRVRTRVLAGRNLYWCGWCQRRR